MKGFNSALLIASTVFLMATSAYSQIRETQSVGAICKRQPLSITIKPSTYDGFYNYGVGIRFRHTNNQPLAFSPGQTGSGDTVYTFMLLELDNVQSATVVLQGYEDYPDQFFVNNGRAYINLWVGSLESDGSSRFYPGNRTVTYIDRNGCTFQHVIPMA